MKYKSLKGLEKLKPQLVKRLLNWALIRKNKFGFLNQERLKKEQQEARKEIELYLDELVLTPSSFTQAKDNLIKWGKILTPSEKQAVGLLIKYDLPQAHFEELKLVHTSDSLIANDWYDGAYKVLAEEVLDVINYKSKEVGLITQNSYNAAILNTDEMMIIDIDITGDSPGIALYTEQAIAALNVLQNKQGLSFRLYKTCQGLRAIETSRAWNPSSYDTKRLMKSVYADPLYVALCSSQECFRARLTPKPWRLFDYIDYDDFTTGKDWLDSTDESEVAVCKLLEVIGSEAIDTKFSNLIAWHDNSTKALISEKNNLALL
jgi:hypothetical protein